MAYNIYTEKELQDFIKQLDDPNFKLKNAEQIHLHNISCPKCSKEHMVIRSSKYDIFAGCNGFPTCKNIIDRKNLKYFISSQLNNSTKNYKVKNIRDINSEGELENFIQQLDNSDFQLNTNEEIHVHNVSCPECQKSYLVLKTIKQEMFAGCSSYAKSNNNNNCKSINMYKFRELAISKLSDNAQKKFITSNPITKYFKNALSAQKNPTIDFKTDKFVIEPNTLNVENGFLNQNATQELFASEEKNDQKKSKPKTTLDVVIALKTFSTVFEGGSYKNDNAEQNELTSILFLPAVLERSGKLYIADHGKLPWIPREYLSPMMDAQISIGTEADYDTFLENSTGERKSIGEDWKKYFNYAKNMYYSVTKNLYQNTFIELDNQKIKLDNQYYIFKDDSVYATQNVLNLYTYLKNHPENKLYATITNLNPAPSRPPYGEDDMSQMMKHSGQMGGEYPLSPSQREAIHTFAELKEGEVLAVSGPPGTGKTTLLQSVVATMLVEHALQEKRPPIIVAASTNNQAVTNIVSSFEKINAVGIRNLEKRWVYGVKNFATYFPSKTKKEEAIKKDYQWTNNLGGNFFQNVESEENRTESKALFIQEFNALFHSQYSTQDLSSAKAFLAEELKNMDNNRRALLSNTENLKQEITAKNKECNTYSKYITTLDSEIAGLQSTISDCQKRITDLENDKKYFLTRMKEWSSSYDSLPIFLKLLSFLPFCKRKLLTWFTSFQQERELKILKDYMPIEKIQETYRELINTKERTIVEAKSLCENTKTELQSKKEEKLTIQTKYHKLLELFETFKTYDIFTDPKEYEVALDQLEVKKLNNLFDCKIRYIEFWLAVHYYEAVWLSEDLNREDAMTDSPTKKSLTILFERIAMLSPCMVMTFFMLPKQFFFYANKLNHYMLNYVDLLIVDEAGQTSPEVAAASFSLAKKAIVVGDEKQIPPVWGTDKALDISMAIENRVIHTKDDFKLLEENGLNCSHSSIMKVAAMSCIYDKFEKGLFLSEHRRCYDEIIQYCNVLVYKDRLDKMRGSFGNDDNNPLIGYLPPMGHKQITVANSQQAGTSRKNQEEAEQIIIWLEKNYPILLKKYKKTNPDEILGIITPFKAQATLIKKELNKNKNLSEYQKNISIGTVHSFQGAEYKVIIFSSVYGNQDGCFFINQHDSLMNVAVSRAKDSFLVFGDSGCLVEGGNKPVAPLLKKATIHEI